MEKLGVIKAEDLPLDEKVYLKKGLFGWKVVYPIRNEDKSINWKHLIVGGTWWNLLIITIIVAVIVGVIYEYSSTIEMFLDCFKDPVKLGICQKAFGPPDNLVGQLAIPFTP